MPLNDELGDRIKSYEAHETSRLFLPMLPIYARLDGRSFHSFTKHMERPFDVNMHSAMSNTLQYLVEETGATVGYTQSDEISLGWYNPDLGSEMFFNRKIFKLSSVLAGMASAKFNHSAMNFWPETTMKKCPAFDCRVFQVPNVSELANCFLWRELDAAKNSITMAAQSFYSHRELHGKNGLEKNEMLLRKGVDFNSYPDWAKRGVFAQRVTKETLLSDEIRMKIPEAKRPPVGQMVTRSSVNVFALPPLLTISNREAVLFSTEEPILFPSKQ